MSPSAKNEIMHTIKVIGRKKIGKNVVIISDKSCEMCKIYDMQAKMQFAKNNYNILSHIYYEREKLEEIKENILKMNPDFIFINIPSFESGYFMSKFRGKKIIFVGTKMLGNDIRSDSAMNFDINGIKGFIVRPIPPKGYNTIKMQMFSFSKIESRRLMDSPFYMMYFIEKITEVLCKHKPKTRNDFINIVNEKKYLDVIHLILQRMY